jgi:hypothetical protein
VSIIAPCFEPQSPLREKTVLSLHQFHGCGASFVVVRHVIDPRAYCGVEIMTDRVPYSGV